MLLQLQGLLQRQRGGEKGVAAPTDPRGLSRAQIEAINRPDPQAAPGAHSFAPMKTFLAPCPSWFDHDVTNTRRKLCINDRPCRRATATNALLAELDMPPSDAFGSAPRCFMSTLEIDARDRCLFMSLSECAQGQPATGDLRSQLQALLGASELPRQHKGPPRRRKPHPLYSASGSGGTASGAPRHQASSLVGRSRSQPPSPTGISKARVVCNRTSRGPARGKAPALLHPCSESAGLHV